MAELRSCGTSRSTSIPVVANRPDIMAVDRQGKKAIVVDVTIPSDSNIRKKEHEKLEKYQGLKESWKGCGE